MEVNTAKKRGKYEFASLEPGQSFLIDSRTVKSLHIIQMSCYQWSLRTGKKFKCRKLDGEFLGQIQVWREA